MNWLATPDEHFLSQAHLTFAGLEGADSYLSLGGILNKLRHQRWKNMVVLVGPPSVGKTSLMSRLDKPSDSTPPPASSANGVDVGTPLHHTLLYS